MEEGLGLAKGQEYAAGQDYGKTVMEKEEKENLEGEDGKEIGRRSGM